MCHLAAMTLNVIDSLIYKSQSLFSFITKVLLYIPYMCDIYKLTYWGRVTHIHVCVSTITVIGSNNGLSPGRRQAIIWTNARILLIGPLGTNFSEILIEIYIFHSGKCIWKCRLENFGHFVSASMCISRLWDVLSLSWIVIISRGPFY